jgi:hypothetical protein
MNNSDLRTALSLLSKVLLVICALTAVPSGARGQINVSMDSFQCFGTGVSDCYVGEVTKNGAVSLEIIGLCSNSFTPIAQDSASAVECSNPYLVQVQGFADTVEVDGLCGEIDTVGMVEAEGEVVNQAGKGLFYTYGGEDCVGNAYSSEPGSNTASISAPC